MPSWRVRWPIAAFTSATRCFAVWLSSKTTRRFISRRRSKKNLALREQRLTLTRKLADAGVKLVAGNDAGVTHCNFSDYPEDLVLTSKGCGFTPLEVLASATGVAAEALGRQDIGRIAVGKAADLLAVAGDPLHNIDDLTQPRFVMANGRTIVAPSAGWEPR